MYSTRINIHYTNILFYLFKYFFVVIKMNIEYFKNKNILLKHSEVGSCFENFDIKNLLV
jgi:hypothetical protein